MSCAHKVHTPIGGRKDGKPKLDHRPLKRRTIKLSYELYAL